VASAKAYIHAANLMVAKPQREHPQREGI